MIAEFLQDHPDVVTICYHTPWPGPLDELYQHNPVQNLARTEYYGVPYVPYAWFDGKIYAYDPTSRYWHDWAYDDVADDPTEVTLTPSGTYDPATRTLSLTVTVDLGAPLPAGDHRLHVVLVEDEVAWAAPNGQTSHDHIMRRMLPDEHGTALTLAGDVPETHTVSVAWTLDDLYVPEHCSLVYFLQDHDEQDVHQAGSVAVTALDAPTTAPDRPIAWDLGPGYPNPFNPQCTIPLRLGRAASVELSVVAVDGRLVRRLHAGHLASGEHRFVWDGRNDAGQPVPSGVYLARARAAAGRSQSQRLMLVK
jgi:hypothetical protein